MTDSLLLVEDDRALRTFLADNLTADGFEHARRRHRRARAAARWRPTRRPSRSSTSSCRAARGSSLIADVRAEDARFARVDPAQRFIVLSGRATELDRVRGLQHGADDYVVKPFSYPELLLRVRALLRRGGGTAGAARLRVGVAGGRPADARRPRRAASRSSCRARSSRCCARSPPSRPGSSRRTSCSATSGASRSRGSTRTLDSHACRLRRKLGVGGDRFVVNVWGVGYRLVDLP